jgi:Spy/CpxP family protein refolding chaperone
MARHIGWVLAVLLLLPTTGRAAGFRDGSSCGDQTDRTHGGQPPGPPHGQPPGSPHKEEPRGEPGQDRPGPPKWWIDAKLRAELGITDQQSSAVEQVWQKSLPGLRDARERLGKLEDTLSKMTSDISDEAAVIVQIERVETTRAELNKGRTLMIYRMHKLLTPDQRAKVKAMKAMYERREPPRHDPSQR